MLCGSVARAAMAGGAGTLEVAAATVEVGAAGGRAGGAGFGAVTIATGGVEVGFGLAAAVEDGLGLGTEEEAIAESGEDEGLLREGVVVASPLPKGWLTGAAGTGAMPGNMCSRNMTEPAAAVTTKTTPRTASMAEVRMPRHFNRKSMKR